MLRRTALVAGAATLAASALTLVPSGAASASVRLAGTLPDAAGATITAAADPAASVEVAVHLGLRDRAGAEALLQAVSTPGSASYGRYLSADAFRARFSPSEADAAKVSAWLRSQGLRVTEVAGSRTFVRATGSVAQVQRAFATTLVEATVGGKTRRVNTTEAAIPAALAGIVTGVTGLAEIQMHSNAIAADPGSTGAAPSVTKDGSIPPPAGFRVAPPCSSYWAEKVDTTNPAYGSGYPKPMPWAPCGYKPAQMRSAYGVDGVVASGVDGTGVTVGIVDAYTSPTLLKDAQTYAKRNDPSHPFSSSQFKTMSASTATHAEECDASGWFGEQSLDVEAVHAMAPGATILYAGARSCYDNDILSALAKIVDANAANLVSNSYGNYGEVGLESEFDAFNTVAIQAGIQGIGLYFSSGDNGDESDNPNYTGPTPAADWSATSPFVIAVGGTSTGIAKDGKVVVEQGWETGRSSLDPSAGWVPGGAGTFLYGAGGGPSRVFKQPYWQQSIVPDSLSKGVGGGRKRVVPDVAMDGDPNTGFLIGITQSFSDGVYYDQYRIGGTSLSSPLFAGMMALADQEASRRHGFANPLFYLYAGTSAFRDVNATSKMAVERRNFNNSENAKDGYSAPSVRTFDSHLESLHTTASYDNVTGVGVPNGTSFLAAVSPVVG